MFLIHFSNMWCVCVFWQNVECAFQQHDGLNLLKTVKEDIVRMENKKKNKMSVWAGVDVMCLSFT